MEMSELPPLVSLPEFSRALGVPYRRAREILLRSNKVELYRVYGTAGKVMFLARDMDVVWNCLLIKVNNAPGK